MILARVAMEFRRMRSVPGPKSTAFRLRIEMNFGATIGAPAEWGRLSRIGFRWGGGVAGKGEFPCWGEAE